MKKIKYLLLILSAIVCFEAESQNFCLTPSDFPNVLQGVSQYQIVNNTYIVRIFFHIIRRTNGTGGQTLTEVETALNVLNSDYAAHGISFSLLGIDEIKDDATYNRIFNPNVDTDFDGDGKFDTFQPNLHPNAIDVYLFANTRSDLGGLASGIPGTALVIGGTSSGVALPSSHVLSHEIGHCLGLYHTFHGTCYLEQGCPELVNGNNSVTCGDFVSDTPADPKIHHTDPNTCAWDGTTCNGSSRDANNQLYNPNNHLIMAYVPPTCMEYHTEGQGVRMRNVIANSSLLHSVTEVYSSVYIGDRTYPSEIEDLLGWRTFNIKGDHIEIANTTINSNATVNVQARASVILKPGFWAKSGSNVSIKATQATSSSLLSAQAMEMEEDANSLTSLEQAVASQKTGNIDFTVYPNPNDGNFTVEITGNTQAYTVEIFNVSGRIMGKVDCNTKSVTINRSDLPSGIYYLKFTAENKSIVKKIIVK